MPAPPTDLRPMKAVKGDLPVGPEWAYEIKWDGMRVLPRLAGDTFALTTTRGRDAADRFPEIGPLATALSPHEVVLDGEIVALDADGRPSFGRLQRRMHLSPAAAAQRMGEVPVVLVLFDVLWLNGIDARPVPYRDRRRILEDLIDDGPAWRVTSTYPADGPALLDAMRERGMEGIVAKRRDAAYETGTRSPAWRKVKVRRRQEFVVGGWHSGRGSLAGRLGGLLVGYHHRDRLVFAGQVGSGIGEADLAILEPRLADLARPGCPFSPAPGGDGDGVHWVEPDLVVEVAFAEWTTDDRLRHPSYLGLRDDKAPGDVVRE